MLVIGCVQKKYSGARRATARLGKQASKVELQERVMAERWQSGEYGGTNLCSILLLNTCSL